VYVTSDPHCAGDPGRKVEGSFVLKHISNRKGDSAKLSGLREAYFGALLHRVNQTVSSLQQGTSRDGLEHLVRFVESFQVITPGESVP